MSDSKQERPIKNIWMVAREYDGLAGTGGVKDVTRQLSEALVRAGNKVSVVLPLYGFIIPEEKGFRSADLAFDVDLNYVDTERREVVKIWQGELDGINLYLADAERYREKMGIYTYTAEEEEKNPMNHQGTAYNDYFAMNVLLQKAALALIVLLEERPDIIHCQDAHTAILPAMIREIEGFRHYFKKTGAVVTIHNAGHGYHQEVGDLPFVKEICNLPYRFILDNLLDGKFNPFLAASSYGVINTVSENYARELQETDDDLLTGWLGHRLLARGVHLEGITNGINPAAFGPGKADAKRAKELGLYATFDPEAQDLSGKRKGKELLVKDLRGGGIPGVIQTGTLDLAPEKPLFTMIGRLMAQKGVDILIAALKKLLVQDEHFQVLIQGVGARDIEKQLEELAADKENLGRVCVLRGYDTILANRIYAAGDFFIIPSKYEPCGLTDFIAQLSGNIPIVHHVGGLVKVVDGVTGFAYQDHSPEALLAAMLRALHTYRMSPDKLFAMRKTAVEYIKKQYTWDSVKDRYLELYRTAINLSESKELSRRQTRGWKRIRAANKVIT
jgi:starch synthase